MKDFFISYNKADKDWAEWVAWQLEESGYTTIIQAWDFRPGGNFVIDMQRAAAECERTIIVLSEDYVKSLFTQPEWAAAFAQDPTGVGSKLLPVRVRECELKGLLAQVVYIDLVGVPEVKAAEVLLAGVGRGRAKPADAPGFPRGGESAKAERTITEKPDFPTLEGTPMRSRRAGRSEVSKASWIFGSGLLLFLIGVFALAPATMPEFKQRLLAVFCSLLAGLMGFFLTGDLLLRGAAKTTFGKLWLKAAGGAALFVLVLIWWLVPGIAPVDSGRGGTPEIYRVRVTVTNPQGVPVEDAKVWSSVGGEPKKVSGGWQFDIPEVSKPRDGKLSIYASQEAAFLRGNAELVLDQDANANLTVRLEHPTDAKVRGRVIDARGRGVAEARVFVTGYDKEAMVTQAGGNFELSAHAADGQQVLVVAEKNGVGVARLWHPAGDTPVELKLQR